VTGGKIVFVAKVDALNVGLALPHKLWLDRAFVNAPA
jgi:hypothetical protein